VIIDDDHTKSFRKTCRFVSTIVPIFERYVPARFRVYLRIAGDDTRAKQAVANNQGPKLVIVKTETVPGHPYTSNGFFWAAIPDRIHLEERNAEKFERDHQAYEIALPYLIMHESIHWVRHHAGLSADLPGPGITEAGDRFEQEAYGRDMSHVWGTGAIACDRGNLRL
jgi:hypothetical protein